MDLATSQSGVRPLLIILVIIKLIFGSFFYFLWANNWTALRSGKRLFLAVIAGLCGAPTNGQQVKKTKTTFYKFKVN